MVVLSNVLQFSIIFLKRYLEMLTDWHLGAFSPNVPKCYLSGSFGWINCCFSFFAGVFIVAAKRTPFGTYGGVLKDHSATDLAEHAAKAALAAGGVAPELVNSVIVGNVMQVQKVL